VLNRRLRAATHATAGQLPAQDVENVLELIEVGEPVLAFDTLCTQLFEYDASVPLSVRDELADLGRGMQLAPSLWKNLGR